MIQAKVVFRSCVDLFLNLPLKHLVLIEMQKNISSVRSVAHSPHYLWPLIKKKKKSIGPVDLLFYKLPIFSLRAVWP